MKKNQRHFGIVGVLALAAVLLIAGCTLDVPDGAEDEAPPPGTVWVKVAVSAPSGSKNARTLDAGFDWSNYNYLELYVLVRGDSTDASGSDIDGSETIIKTGGKRGKVLKLALTPELYYDFLLIAGDDSSMTLLGSAFDNGGGLGVFINPGVPNEVTLQLEYVSSDPTTDYRVYDDAGPTLLYTPAAGTGVPYNGIVKVEIPVMAGLPGTVTTNLQFKVTTNGLRPLALADYNAALQNYPTLESPTLQLLQYGGDHQLDTQTIPGTNPVAGGTDGITYTFLFPETNWSPTAAYGRLVYQAKYRPFGMGTQAGINTQPVAWVIRNGLELLDFDRGTGKSGGAVLVIIGPDPNTFNPPGTVTIITD